VRSCTTRSAKRSITSTRASRRVREARRPAASQHRGHIGRHHPAETRDRRMLEQLPAPPNRRQAVDADFLETLEGVLHPDRPVQTSPWKRWMFSAPSRRTQRALRRDDAAVLADGAAAPSSAPRARTHFDHRGAGIDVAPEENGPMSFG
jgi:hypothetical protein